MEYEKFKWKSWVIIQIISQHFRNLFSLIILSLPFSLTIISTYNTSDDTLFNVTLAQLHPLFFANIFVQQQKPNHYHINTQDFPILNSKIRIKYHQSL